MCKVVDYGYGELGLEYTGDWGTVAEGGVFYRPDERDGTINGVELFYIYEGNEENRLYARLFMMDVGGDFDPESIEDRGMNDGWGDMQQPYTVWGPEPCGLCIVDRGTFYGGEGENECYGPIHGPIGPESDYWASEYGIERYWSVPADLDDPEQLLALIGPMLRDID